MLVFHQVILSKFLILSVCSLFKLLFREVKLHFTTKYCRRYISLCS